MNVNHKAIILVAIVCFSRSAYTWAGNVPKEVDDLRLYDDQTPSNEKIRNNRIQNQKIDVQTQLHNVTGLDESTRLHRTAQEKNTDNTHKLEKKGDNTNNRNRDVRSYHAKIRRRRAIGIKNVLQNKLTLGDSLIGKVVSDLFYGSQEGGVAGSIENFSNQPLHFVEFKLGKGDMNEPMTTVNVGEKEGFASHEGWLLDGNQVKCTLAVANTVKIHIAYEIPMMWASEHNKLALSVCLDSDLECNGRSLNDMLEKTYPYVKRHIYHDTVTTIITCDGGYCIFGTMGTDRRSKMSLEVYPESFTNLKASFQKVLRDNGFDEEHYRKFLHLEKKYSKPNCGNSLMSRGKTLYYTMVIVAIFYHLAY